MTWIHTVSMEDDERVKKAMLGQRAVIPIEYATPVHPENDGQSQASSRRIRSSQTPSFTRSVPSAH